MFVLGIFSFPRVKAQEFNKTTTSLKVNNKDSKLLPGLDTDTIVPTQDSLPSVANSKDSIKPPVKGFLEDIVYRKAKDYNKLDQKKKQITLYNEAEIKYQDFELTAGIIVFNYEQNQIYAGRIKDSLGNLSQAPVFKQGGQVVEPDSIVYNTKSQRALVWQSRTSQGEFNIKSGMTKKENDSVYFMEDVIFTTAKDLDDPEYYFKTKKVKFVPNKKVVVGQEPIWLLQMFPLH